MMAYQGHEYRMDHHGDHFYILSNLNVQNFKLVRTPTGQTSLNNWETIIEHSQAVTLNSIAAFKRAPRSLGAVMMDYRNCVSNH